MQAEADPQAATVEITLLRLGTLGTLPPQIRRAGEDIQRQKKEHRQAVIRRADIVAATLVSAGGELRQLLPPDMLFDAVVIDEVSLYFTISTWVFLFHPVTCSLWCLIDKASLAHMQSTPSPRVPMYHTRAVALAAGSAELLQIHRLLKQFLLFLRLFRRRRRSSRLR